MIYYLLNGPIFMAGLLIGERLTVEGSLKGVLVIKGDFDTGLEFIEDSFSFGVFNFGMKDIFDLRVEALLLGGLNLAVFAFVFIVKSL